jgi:hypothetical protein
MDCLARSARHLLKIVEGLDRKGVALRLLDFKGHKVDTHSRQGKLLLTMFAAFAQFEREAMLERQRTITPWPRLTMCAGVLKLFLGDDDSPHRVAVIRPGVVLNRIEKSQPAYVCLATDGLLGVCPEPPAEHTWLEGRRRRRARAQLARERLTRRDLYGANAAPLDRLPRQGGCKRPSESLHAHRMALGAAPSNCRRSCQGRVRREGFCEHRAGVRAFRV